MAVSRRLRYEILRRDAHACRYCGAAAPDVPLTVDHVVPVALGGSDDPTNLVTACKDCNAGKAAVSPDSEIVANVADDALRWAAAMRHAANIQAVNRDALNDYIDRFDEAWCDWTYVDCGEPIERPQAWRDSIKRFFEVGIELDLLLDAMRRAMEKRTRGEYGAFRYMCGICWGVLEERQEMARSLIEMSTDDA